jgi:hypothetical protein
MSELFRIEPWKSGAKRTAFILSLALIPVASRADVPHPSDTMVFTSATQGGNCAECGWIAAEGPITRSTAQDLEAFLKSTETADGAKTVRLSSDGGDLIGGLELGETIRTHKLRTEVGRTIADPSLPLPPSGEPWNKRSNGGCYSACAYAFLGGIQRTAKTGDLGFHQFYSRNSVKEALKAANVAESAASAQRIMGLLVIYLKEMSVDPELLSFASANDPGSIFRPDTETMYKMGITNVRETPQFSGWTIEPYKDGAVVTGKLTGGSDEDHQIHQITFFCRNNVPRKVFMLASWQWDSAAANRAAADNTSIHRSIHGSTVRIGGQVVRNATGYESIAEAHVDTSDTWLTYILTAEEFAAAVKSGELTVEVDVPHSLNYSAFIFSPPMTGMEKPARIAFKSCL